MPCTETAVLRQPVVRQAVTRWGPCVTLALLAGCSSSPAPAPAPVPVAVPANAPARPTASPSPAAPQPPGPGGAAPSSARAAPPPAQAAVRTPRYVTLGPPATPRNAHELRLQFAQRLVAAHPDTTYTARAPERLLAIPVLEVEFNADGSVRRIEVLRKPTTGNEATQLAIAAVQRAAPYGNLARLPKPWKVVETFLFDDELRFKPRTLD